jgi:hypothetical protein
VQDNSALLNAISIKLRKLKKNRELMNEAKRLIGEEEDGPKKFDPAQHRQDYENIVKDNLPADTSVPKVRATDEAVVFYPQIDMGIPLSGPRNPTEMMNTFFREDMPDLFPDAAEVMSELTVEEMCNTALEHGMVVLFGQNGTMNQIMAKNPNRVAKDRNDAAILKKVFQDIAPELVWLTDMTTVEPKRISAQDALGINLVGWKRA